MTRRTIVLLWLLVLAWCMPAQADSTAVAKGSDGTGYYVENYVVIATVFDSVAVNDTDADTSRGYLLTGKNVGYGYYSANMRAVETTGTSHLKVTYQLSFGSTPRGLTGWGYERGAAAVTDIISDFSQLAEGTAAQWPIYLIEPMPAIYIRFIVLGLGSNGSAIEFSMNFLKHPL